MLENVILSIGTPDFDRVLFSSFERELRTRQVVLHRFGSAADPETLIAQDNRPDGCVHSLVHDYVNGYHRYDPFRSSYRACEVRQVEVRDIAVKEIAVHTCSSSPASRGSFASSCDARPMRSACPCIAIASTAASPARTSPAFME
jgi:hypothetical protein